MRFENLPSRLREAGEISAKWEGLTAFQHVFLMGLLEDAALRIEALERDGQKIEQPTT